MSPPDEQEGPARPQDPGTDPNAWMSTFSDLLMLMLTFFVLLLSMSSLDHQKIRSVTRDGLNSQRPEVLEDSHGPPSVLEVPSPHDTISELRRALDVPLRQAEVARVEQLLAEVHSSSGLQGPLWVELRPEGLLIHIEASVAFEPSSSELTPQARAFVKQFAQVVREGNYDLVTTAFVDASMQGRRGEGSWEMALRRADVVVQALINARLAPQRLSLAGYGWAAGARQGRLLRQPQLIQFQLVAGPPGAEPHDPVIPGAD